jgi:hypothetical protein
MPRCTRSIVLVLIGVALPACDGRQQRDVDPPVEPDGSFGGGSTTQPSTLGGGSVPYRYGSAYTGGHAGAGWMGGTGFGGHYGGGATDAEGHGFGSSHPFAGGHVSFGGFGSHASHGGS